MLYYNFFYKKRNQSSRIIQVVKNVGFTEAKI